MDVVAERAYHKRYQSVRGYDALLQSLPKKSPSEPLESDSDLESEIRKSLAARVSESANVWELGGPGSSPKKDIENSVSMESKFELNDDDRSRESQSKSGKEEPIVPSFTQIMESNGPRIYDWSSIRHVDLVHRQGLHAPPLIIEYVDSRRPYYRAAYLDPLANNQRVPFLYIRQKRRKLKFRMSFDESIMCKFGNPKYAGKCTVKTCDADRMICVVSSKKRQPIGTITITSKSGKHDVRVEMTGEYLNWHETGPEGLVMSGHINNYLDPVLLLRVESSNRGVLEIRKSSPLLPPVNEAYEHQSHAMVYVDYPLTLFLSTIICVIVDSRRRGIQAIPK